MKSGGNRPRLRYRFVEIACGDAEQSCEVSIQHYPFATEQEDFALDVFDREHARWVFHGSSELRH